MSPLQSLQLLEQYAFVILPALTVAEQIGVPLPAWPALLAVGALAAGGRICIPLVLEATSVAALAIDLTWYELGRRRGAYVLARLFRLSLEPNTWAHRAEEIFTRHGAASILVAKFIPGVTTIIPPLAGVFAVARARFALYDLAGVLLWAGTWLTLGYLFSDAIALITARVIALEHMLGFVIGTVFAGYMIVRYGRRQLLRRRLRTTRSGRTGLDRRGDVSPKQPAPTTVSAVSSGSSH